MQPITGKSQLFDSYFIAVLLGENAACRNKLPALYRQLRILRINSGLSLHGVITIEALFPKRLAKRPGKGRKKRVWLAPLTKPDFSDLIT
jgi:hypothetical protein